jgi:phosphoserine phosphatase
MTASTMEFAIALIGDVFMAVFKPPPRLAFFDVDGTLKLGRDPYIHLHEQLGTLEQGLAHIEMVECGEIDYDQWGQLDARLWAGQEVTHVTHLLSQIPWTPGARQFVSALRRRGAVIALVSTGLDLHVNSVADEIGAEFTFANQLVVSNGRLTGEFRTLIPEKGKGEIVERVMAQVGVAVEECIAAGDGVSDVPMFQRVGWSVAVAASDERVRQAASLTLDTPDLTPLMRLFED